MGSVMTGLLPGPAAPSLVPRPLVLSPGIRPSVTVGRDRIVIAAGPGASGGLEGEGQVVVDEADRDRALADG
jgi:hypothetical protein